MQASTNHPKASIVCALNATGILQVSMIISASYTHDIRACLLYWL